MRVHYRHTLLHELSFFSSIRSPLGTEALLHSPAFLSNSSRMHCLRSHRLLFSAFSLKQNYKNCTCSLGANGYSFTSRANVLRPVYLENANVKKEDMHFTILKQRLKEVGMDIDVCVTGQSNHLLCPKCMGGNSEERTLSLFMSKDGRYATWKCFHGKCGWKGSRKALAGTRASPQMMEQATKIKKMREITEAGLQLEPLCDELLGYFAERMISKETLQRNAVKQKVSGDEIIIAFPYHRQGVLVSCKYRDINKRFWQETDTEKIFYGLDDIEGKSDIIIVEGEMDKLAMEEAGFQNCVSVPDGAPVKVSTKELPPEEKDTKYRYLWNCKEYLSQASRIILATDGDQPGQALAEELARRLGKERCWWVRWPKKNKSDYFKDANEVLMYLGADVLKQVIENAELYPIRGLFNFRDYFDEIDAYYHGTLGYELGVSTGWSDLVPPFNNANVLKEDMQFTILKQKLKEVGMDIDVCMTGQSNHLHCPKCMGGNSEERTLSLFISEDGGYAMWRCFRGKCGWRGSRKALAGTGSSPQMMEQATEIKKTREITEVGLQLEPLCDELLGYFAERMISKETLWKNAVKQKVSGDEIIIAFPYHRQGVLVSCKYRDINKRFWQEAGTEMIFYGLDDIEGKSDIIIVEGEMDKLAMEEVGFWNCVSVPNGAPSKVSTKELPPEEKDTEYRYLWNCKEYLSQASRIVLATDGDQPGQALAEELARRLGKERCWRVRWPKKNKSDYFKDANEVLMYLGADVLKEVIENAELYPVH